MKTPKDINSDKYETKEMQAAETKPSKVAVPKSSGKAWHGFGKPSK